MRTGHTDSGLYEIRVQGRLEPRWAAWFDGFTLAPGPDGTTVIAGTVVDQAALHGLLQALRDLGLPLVSVTLRRQGTSAETVATGEPNAPAHDRDGTIPAQEEPR